MTGWINRILLFGCETTNPVDANLPNRPGVGEGVLCDFFLSFFLVSVASWFYIPCLASCSAIKISASSGSSKAFTQARAFRGSKIGWAVEGNLHCK